MNSVSSGVSINYIKRERLQSGEEPNDRDVRVNGEYTREKGKESCSLHKAE